MTKEYWKFLVRTPHLWWPEFKYWQITRRLQHFRPWLAKFYPKWLIDDALIHASQKIRDHEHADKVSFIEVYSRWYDEGRSKR